MSEVELILKGIHSTLNTSEKEKLTARLAEQINELILHDFQALVQILYTIDVQESKLKELLKKNENKDAASIIAEQIIERHLQKIKSKQSYNASGTVPDEEKW